MAESDKVSDITLEDKLVDFWQDFPCLYDVRPHISRIEIN